METRKNLFPFSAQFAFRIAIFIALALFAGGCASFTLTNPPRSATEQLLLSTSADRALANADLQFFAGKKVFLDTTYFDSYDSKYAVGEIRDALSRAGALLMPDAKSAGIIMEARSGALSDDSADSLIGVPSTGLPIPLAGAISIPEIALYKSDKQFAYAKIALLAYANESRAHIYSSGPLTGKSYNKYHKILFVAWTFTDIPEKQKKPADAEKNQTWFPQYDLTNIPAPGAVTKMSSVNMSSTNAPPSPATNLPSTNVLPTNAPATTNDPFHPAL
ncbi:MAG TPA: DUF6655 family protein [Verrucomicrobiae bacterium]|jgi:hypothetical protein